MTTDYMEVHLNSSANDVWGAITAATALYPKAMRGLYHQIKSIKGDGFTSGSMRTITFGYLYERVVKNATEEIRDVDHENLTIKSRFTDNGGFVPKLFDTFDMKITVVRSSRQIRAPGCTIKWEFEYDRGSGTADIGFLKNVMSNAFKELDTYLRNHRGVRPWP
ncbi:MLP-like protein 423 [Linum grandiflorum]